MNIQDIEKKIHELNGKQSDYFKKKKAERNASELEAVRQELNSLKQEAKTHYQKMRVQNKKELKNA